MAERARCRRLRGAPRRGCGARAAGRARPRSRPLGRALEPRPRCASGPATGWSSSTCAAPDGTRELEREELSLERWAADLGASARGARDRAPRACRTLARREHRAQVRARAARTPSRALVLIGADANLSNLAPRMLASAERIESDGPRGLGRRVLVEEPAVLAARRCERDPGILEEYRRSAARRTIPSTTSASAVRSRRRRASADRLGRGDAAGARARRRQRRPHAARARPAARERLADARVVELPDVGHTLPLEAPEETAAAMRAFLDEVAEREGSAARVLRADTTPRNSTEGPFGHLDVRWVVGAADRRVADLVRPVDLPAAARRTRTTTTRTPRRW